MSGIVPNSFQYPNIFIDRLQYLLTPEENTVLTKAIREILGWAGKIETRQGRISLSVFVDGKVNKKTGERICYGCGLKVGAIRNALAVLDKRGILIKIGEATNDGQMYTLQGDETKIDWDWLQNRKDGRSQANEQRTRNARTTLAEKAKGEAPGGTVGQHPFDEEGVLSDSIPGVLSDSTPGVLSDSNKETQRNPVETQTTTTTRASDEILTEPKATPDILTEFENLFTAHFGELSGNPKDPLTADVKAVLKEYGAATTMQAIRTAIVDRANGKPKTWGYVKAILRGEKADDSQNRQTNVAAGDCSRKSKITGPARVRDRPRFKQFTPDLPCSGISLGD
jgi:hypothetical protein